jgi:hypothetical protein
MSGCSVFSVKRRPSVLTIPSLFHTFDSQQVARLKPQSARYDVARAMKYDFAFAFCAVGDPGKKGIFYTSLKV